MTRRTVLLAVAAWLAVVAVGSVVTWLVIDSAGQRVLVDSPAPLVTGQPTASPWISATASSRSRPDGPSSTPAHPPRRSDHHPATPRPAASPRPTPYQERTWRDAPGSVVVRCSGQAASLQWATPSNGYRVEIGGRGPGDVEVTFNGDDTEVKVRAACTGGVPDFTTETSSGE